VEPVRLLVVTADTALRDTLARELRGVYDVVFASGESEALAYLATGGWSLLVLDSAGGTGKDAFTLRERFLAAGHAVPMVMMPNQGDEDLAVEALHRGFMDYIVKRERNLQEPLLRKRFGNTIELARLKRENERLQGAIQESQQRLYSIYDSLDDVILQIDHDCRIVSLNRSAAAHANCEPKDAVGRICWQVFDFYPCERRARKAECHIYRTFLEGETIRGEREDASSRTIHQYMTFITTLDDADYVVYRESDITEKRRLEQKVANALRSLGVTPPEERGP
jgi:PAS domain-containing protein